MVGLAPCLFSVLLTTCFSQRAGNITPGVVVWQCHCFYTGPHLNQLNWTGPASPNITNTSNTCICTYQRASLMLCNYHRLMKAEWFSWSKFSKINSFQSNYSAHMNTLFMFLYSSFSFPFRISQSSSHHAHCYVPAEVKFVLDQKPSLISPVVQAFYGRDPVDMKVCYAIINNQYSNMLNECFYSA